MTRLNANDLNTIKQHYPEHASLARVNNLTGQQFDYWTVLYRYYLNASGGSAKWVCKCECGNIGLVKSSDLLHHKSTNCGCIRNKTVSEQLTIDEIGNQYGKLTVIGKEGSDKFNQALWRCKCECGREIVTTGCALRQGTTTTCGNASHRAINELGNTYGKLTVIAQATSVNDQAMWLCQCECGGHKIVSGHDLRLGRVNSCGCMISKGEAMVSQVLQQMQTHFIQQYTFDDCVSPKGNKLKYDFAVFKDNKISYLIEYDGQQHFMYQDSNSWNTKEHYDRLMIHDEIKNQYCKAHNLNLIRIPYTIKTADKIFEYIKQKEREFNAANSNR